MGNRLYIPPANRAYESNRPLVDCKEVSPLDQSLSIFGFEPDKLHSNVKIPVSAGIFGVMQRFLWYPISNN